MSEQTIVIEDQNGCEYEAEITFTASYTPAKIDGPPEDCYPAEGESEATIDSLYRNDEDGMVEINLQELDEETKTTLNGKVYEWVEENGVEICQEEAEDAYADAQRDSYDDFYDDRY